MGEKRETGAVKRKSKLLSLDRVDKEKDIRMHVRQRTNNRKK